MKSRLSIQNGFSLLELLVVLMLISVLGTIAIRSTVDIGYSARYEQTRDRLESIRTAIVGNPKRTINGQPDISGFVADMGRLPVTIKELLVAPLDCDGLAQDGNGDSDGTNDVCPFDTTGNVNAGWNGPYLNVSGNPADNDTYTDGWGRESADGNYGWVLTTPVVNSLSVKSYGKDQENGSLGTEFYDEDADVTINASDWLVDISAGVTVSFNTEHSGSCPDNTTYTNKLECNDNTATGWVYGYICPRLFISYRSNGFITTIQAMTMLPDTGIQLNGRHNTVLFKNFQEVGTATQKSTIPNGSVFVAVNNINVYGHDGGTPPLYSYGGSPVNVTCSGTAVANYQHIGVKQLWVAGQPGPYVYW